MRLVSRLTLLLVLIAIAFTAKDARSFGAPGDVNDGFWSWVNQNSATASWTNGMMNIAAPSRGGSDNLNCMSHAVPASTPYTFVAVLYENWNSVNTTNLNDEFMFGLTDGTKLETIGVHNSNSFSQTVDRVIVTDWTSVSALSAEKAKSNQGVSTNPIYLKFQNDGTNLTYWWSPDGITYTQVFSAAKGAFLSTLTKYVICTDSNNGASSQDIDYIRRTQ